MHRRFANPRQTFNINLHEIQLELLNEKCFFNKQHSSFTENAILSSLSAEIYCSFCAAAFEASSSAFACANASELLLEIKLITRSKKVVQRFFIFRCAVRMTWRLERFFFLRHAFFVFCLFCMCNMTFHSRNLSNDKRGESKKWNEFIGELLEIRAEWFIESAAFFSNPSVLCRSDGEKLRREDSWFSPSVRHY